MSVSSEFFRSINLKEDIAHPERFGHFHATTKSCQVIASVLQGAPSAASLVIAPYGSGKSLAAGVGALLVNNHPSSRDLTGRLVERLNDVSEALSRFASHRLDEERRGQTITLYGYVPNLGEVIAKQLDLRHDHSLELEDVLHFVKKSAKEAGIDRVAIVWDEFGRHLEELVSSGRTSLLKHVELLAEWAVRQSSIKVTLTLLLHQSLLAYANRLNQTARKEWRKIEGRFEVLRFIENSNEMYKLIADLVAESRPPSSPAAPSQAWFLEQAERALAESWFNPSYDGLELASTMEKAWPLTPAALYILPLVSARLAQNERSTFSLLHCADLSRPQSLEDLYQYFSESMRMDSGLGGTHRRWLETESARNRANSAIEREVLAAACLLKLGTGGEQRRLSRTALRLALEAAGHAAGQIDQAINRLIEQKLLLHRKKTDDVAIWHGADIDLRSRIDEEKVRLQGGWNHVTFLSHECPPPVRRPIRYNVDFGINRYYVGEFIPASELRQNGCNYPAFSLAPEQDGKIVYAIAETSDDLQFLREFATDRANCPPGIVLAIPKHPLELVDASTELAALVRMHDDRELLDSDPLVQAEINELTVMAREHLHRLVEHLTDPSGRHTEWYSEGQQITLTSGQPLGEALSVITERRFSRTPRLLNEQIIRHRVSRPMVNARKKAILGILERSGSPALGFAGQTTPDASVYRTLLERTGLYRESSGGWRWVNPQEVADENLRAVWATLQSFYTEPTASPKAFSELFQHLMAPPYGLRKGVLPILVAAGLKAFGRCIAIRKDGEYLVDILASEIEAICTDSEAYALEVRPFDEETKDYLLGVIATFSHEEPELEDDLVRQAFDALEAWKASLPPAALTTRLHGVEVGMLQDALRKQRDPLVLLFDDFPRIVDAPTWGATVVEKVIHLRKQIDSLVEGYAARAIEIIAQTLTLPMSEKRGDLLTNVREWSDCFPTDKELLDTLDSPSRALLNQARTVGRHTEISFARALSAMLVGKSFERWDDRTVLEFGDLLRKYADRIESLVFQSERVPAATTPLLYGRLSSLFSTLQKAVGQEEATQLLDRLKTGAL